MNEYNAIGRLTFQVKNGAKNEGKSYVSNSLAINSYDSLKKEKKTVFVPIKAFGKTAELMIRYMQKGDLVGITGSFQNESYEGKDGTRKSNNAIYIKTIYIIGSRNEIEEMPTDDLATKDSQYAEDTVPLPFEAPEELPF